MLLPCRVIDNFLVRDHFNEVIKIYMLYRKRRRGDKFQREKGGLAVEPFNLNGNLISI